MNTAHDLTEAHGTVSAAQRGADWLVAHVEPDGSIRGGTSINEYYKTVFALAAAGRHGHADRMLSYVVRRFLRDDGDLDGGSSETTATWTARGAGGSTFSASTRTPGSSWAL
jgi:squalene cyclase